MCETDPKPSYTLLLSTRFPNDPGRWRFVIRAGDGSVRLMAEDVEPDTRGERLELLTLVRGLEALDEPARVTVVTHSLHLQDGLRFGLPEWRRNRWRWEWFGYMVPVKNADLWQRLDRTMQFHEVSCKLRRLDRPHATRQREIPPAPHFGLARAPRELAAGGLGKQLRRVGWATISLLAWLLSGGRPGVALRRVGHCP